MSLSEPSIEPQGRIAVVNLSGGMDSTSLLLHLLARDCRVHGLSFDYGQKHRLELQRLNANLEYLRTRGWNVSHELIDIHCLGRLFRSALTDPNWEIPEGFYEHENMKQTVVPNRNAIFASISYGFALSLAEQHQQPVLLSLGVHSGDHLIYPDCRPEFYRSIYAAFVLGNWNGTRVELYLPFLTGNKFTILRDAQQSIRKLGLDFDTIFRNTSTSYAPDAQGRASGRTGADVERILAFHQLGLRDPIEYAIPWEQALELALADEAQSRSQN